MLGSCRDHQASSKPAMVTVVLLCFVPLAGPEQEPDARLTCLPGVFAEGHAVALLCCTQSLHHGMEGR